MDKFVQLPFVIPQTDTDYLENYVKSLLSNDINIEKMDEKINIALFDALPKATNFLKIKDMLNESTKTYALNEEEKLYFAKKLTQAVGLKIVDNGIASFSDKNSDILDLIKDTAPEFSRNPRDLKRFINIFRFLFFLKWAREGQGKSSPSLEQLCRWITLSMKWPDVERWLRYSSNRPEGWAQGEETISSSTNRLRLLEDIGANSNNMDNWLSEIKERLQLSFGDIPWIVDDDLRTFFYREGNLAIKDRLSQASGMGLW